MVQRLDHTANRDDALAEPLPPAYAAILLTVDATDEEKAEIVSDLRWLARQILRRYLAELGRLPVDEHAG